MSLLKKNEKFLSKTFISQSDFAHEYKQLCSKDNRAKELYLTVMQLLQKSVESGNLNDLKRYESFIELIHESESESNLIDYYKKPNNVLKNTNLAILASRYNKDKVLNYLFDSECKLLKKLSEVSCPLSPEAKDEMNHNAFYYAIRSGNNKLLKILCSKWPNNHFGDRPEELDEIISSAYEELKLKNVPLSDEMEISIERKILNLRFFSNKDIRNNKNGFKNDSINNRIDLIIEKINALGTEYEDKAVDNIFLFKATFIARNIHVMKQQLKFTYGQIPWEEMEFILVGFVSSHLKKQEMNLFYNLILNKSKVLFYLQKFSQLLEWGKKDLKFFNKFDIRKANRQHVIQMIMRRCPDLKAFYKDFQQLRDIFSLEKINEYMKLAISTDPKNREGQLIITRVLQVVGEYLKNTLESPNLSETISNGFLILLQKDVREILIGLRNSLSHSYSLFKRAELEKTQDAGFFRGVQKDAKIIQTEVFQILFKERSNLIKTLFEKTKKTTNPEKLLDIVNVFESATFNEENIKEDEERKVQTKLHRLLKNFIKTADGSNEVKIVISKIENIIRGTEKQMDATKNSYLTAVRELRLLSCVIKSKIDDNDLSEKSIRKIHSSCESSLCKLDSEKDEVYDFYDDLTELTKIWASVGLSSKTDLFGLLNPIMVEINFYVKHFHSGDMKNIEILRDKLLGQSLEKNCCNESVDYGHQLELKLGELRTILKNNSLGHSVQKLQLYKNNKRLQAVVEMLVLDIMSILNSSKHYLENNLLFLDDYSPLLTGKTLRNHLAHDNVLLNILLSDPSLSVILNAKKLTEEDILKSNKKIGKPLYFESHRLTEKYERGLTVIKNQNSLFKAAEEGDLGNFENLLKTGSDVYARDSHSRTTLHFAAKSSNLELVKFIIDHGVTIDVFDEEGQNPLHIAATHGRSRVVEFFINERKTDVDVEDKKSRTPLHLAAQYGHVKTVKALLKCGARKFLKDGSGKSATFKATEFGQVEIVQILLENEDNVDSDHSGGSTVLHQAVKSGCMEIVTYLIEKGASIENKCDLGRTPLHEACSFGNIDAVKLLIDKGAKIDPQDIKGYTPLFRAIRSGSNDTVKLLISHGADVNIRESIDSAPPLHLAAQLGHVEIVETLLKSNAKPNSRNKTGATPLVFAIDGEHVDVVRVLLNNGADIGAKDYKNWTPLAWGVKTNNVKIVESLLKHKAFIKSTALIDSVTLLLACKNRSKNIIELLLRAGAKINPEDKGALTPLMVAAEDAEVDVVKLLVENKAIVNRKSRTHWTALLGAAKEGRIENVRYLLTRGAAIDSKDEKGATALHWAAIGGFVDIVELLIKHGAKVDQADDEGVTAVHFAVNFGHLDLVKFLISKGANLEPFRDKCSLMQIAMKNNNPELIETLISHGAGNENIGINKALSMAVLLGYTKIVKILLEKYKKLASSGKSNDRTFLHTAAQVNQADIVQLLIDYGADVNATRNSDNFTPICAAVSHNSEESVKILIKNGAELDVECSGATLLHVAVRYGYLNIVKILLDNNVDTNVKNEVNQIPLEEAIYLNHLPIVKELIKRMQFDVNDKICMDGAATIFQTAVAAMPSSNLDMIKFIVNDLGADIHIRNHGWTALHVAASLGQKDVVKFLIDKGLDVDVLAHKSQTPLHCAATLGQVEVAEYLLSKCADVNTEDKNGETPLTLATDKGHDSVAKLLLENGAFYSVVSETTKRANQLLQAVRSNDIVQVEKCIENGAVINAKTFSDATPLHHACWKGYAEIVMILLKNHKCDPNIRVGKGYAPLHYAAKFNHYEIVKMLLENGVIFDAASDSGKTPLDLANGKDTVYLLNLLHKLFTSIEEGSIQELEGLKKLKDQSLWKSILRARNGKNQTLVVAAEHSKFSLMDRLKDIVYATVKLDEKSIKALRLKNDYKTILAILKKTLDARRDLLGPDNVGTLDILHLIGDKYRFLDNYTEAKTISETVYEKRKLILGSDHVDTLKSKNLVATVLQEGFEKYEESLKISREVYPKQLKILGPKHEDTYDTLFNIAESLRRLGQNKQQFTESLTTYQECMNIIGPSDLGTIAKSRVIDLRYLTVKNNMALIKSELGQFDEAMKDFQEVYELEKLFYGPHDSSSLDTLKNMAMVFFHQKNYPKAEERMRMAWIAQKTTLGAKHPLTLQTQKNLAAILIRADKLLTAYKAYKRVLNPIKEVFGSSHHLTWQVTNDMKQLNKDFLFLHGISCEQVVQSLQNKLREAAKMGNDDTVKNLLAEGIDVDDVDDEGRSAINFAVTGGRVKTVEILIREGASLMNRTKKGETILSSACAVGCKEIVNLLLCSISCRKTRCHFINERTRSGMTALHEAAKKGQLDVITLLLQNGAFFDLKNNENKTPADLCKNEKCKDLLYFINDIFEGGKRGNDKIIEKLKNLSTDMFSIVSNVRNSCDKSLLQIVMLSKRKAIVEQLLTMLKQHKCQ